MAGATEVVRSFVDRINAHDPAGLLSLLGDDRLLCDALGSSVREGYFRLVPDYAISVENLIEDGERVGVFGTARGTCSQGGSLRAADSWRLPAAWQAAVHDGKLTEWRVYRDTKTVFEILARQAAKAGGQE